MAEPSAFFDKAYKAWAKAELDYLKAYHEYKLKKALLYPSLPGKNQKERDARLTTLLQTEMNVLHDAEMELVDTKHKLVMEAIKANIQVNVALTIPASQSH